MGGQQLDFSDDQLTTAKKQTKRDAGRRDVVGIASRYRRAANKRSVRSSLDTSRRLAARSADPRRVQRNSPLNAHHAISPAALRQAVLEQPALEWFTLKAMTSPR
jgi:hypothetical protein